MQKQEKASGPKAAPSANTGSGLALPRRAVFEDISWIDEKGQRITVDAEADLGGDGLLDAASFRIVHGRLAGDCKNGEARSSRARRSNYAS